MAIGDREGHHGYRGHGGASWLQGTGRGITAIGDREGHHGYRGQGGASRL